MLHVLWCGVRFLWYVYHFTVPSFWPPVSSMHAFLPNPSSDRTPSERTPPPQECAALQPTMLDFLQRKGRVLRKMGALTRAAETVDSARMLDKADRYMNSKVRRQRTVLCAYNCRVVSSRGVYGF